MWGYDNDLPALAQSLEYKYLFLTTHQQLGVIISNYLNHFHPQELDRHFLLLESSMIGITYHTT